MKFEHKTLQANTLEIVPLSVHSVSNACRLVDSTFSHHKSKRYRPSERIRNYLKSKKWKFDDKEYFDLKYFVLKQIDSSRVLGLVGFYRIKKDCPVRIWIDWLVVEPESRGKGFGSLLVDFAIAYAKHREKNFLMLYTTNHKNEEKAQTLYAQKGFRLKAVKTSVSWTGFVKEKLIA